METAQMKYWNYTSEDLKPIMNDFELEVKKCIDRDKGYFVTKVSIAYKGNIYSHIVDFTFKKWPMDEKEIQDAIDYNYKLCREYIARKIKYLQDEGRLS